MLAQRGPLPVGDLPREWDAAGVRVCEATTLSLLLAAEGVRCPGTLLEELPHKPALPARSPIRLVPIRTGF